jgi:hypothetical protein
LSLWDWEKLSLPYLKTCSWPYHAFNMITSVDNPIQTQRRILSLLVNSHRE